MLFVFSKTSEAGEVNFANSTYEPRLKLYSVLKETIYGAMLWVDLALQWFATFGKSIHEFLSATNSSPRGLPNTEIYL